VFESSFLKPEKVLSELDLRENMIVADFGCGAGGWVIPLAKRLEEGKVYAIDVQEEMLSALKGKAELERVTNIETILLDLESSEGVDLIDNFFDIILMTNLLFQLEDKYIVIEEGRRLLKKGGQLLIVDWNKVSPMGPQEGRVNPGDVKKIAEDLGLKLKKEFEAGDHHFALLFTKP